MKKFSIIFLMFTMISLFIAIQAQADPLDITVSWTDDCNEACNGTVTWKVTLIIGDECGMGAPLIVYNVTVTGITSSASNYTFKKVIVCDDLETDDCLKMCATVEKVCDDETICDGRSCEYNSCFDIAQGTIDIEVVVD
jgi:hypothetical protein